MRIALFTSFSPEIGGGSVQLRSHLDYLPELHVRWYYSAAEPTQRKDCFYLGKPFSGGQLTLDLCGRAGIWPRLTKQVRQIIERMDADLYWVVAHYEGICVADELLRMGRPVHLTIHDEPLATLIRSRRYRALWPVVNRVFGRVLRGAKSVDVTSTKMRDYLNEKYGVNCFALYRHLQELPKVEVPGDSGTLRIGHIGSLYHARPFRQFVLACREIAAEQRRALKIVRIGSSRQMDEVASQNLVTFESHRELAEEDAIRVLAGCDFVYAMYPDGFRFKGFRRTSLPIKLSTYIQAQRPIFAHTPLDSGLAELVTKFNVGKVCSSVATNEIKRHVGDLLSSVYGREQFENIRRGLMGREQLEHLKGALAEPAIAEIAVRAPK
jgi:hypothetical protein